MKKSSTAEKTPLVVKNTNRSVGRKVKTVTAPAAPVAPTRGTKPASVAAALAAKATAEPTPTPPVLGYINTDYSKYAPTGLLTELSKVKTGMTGNMYYPNDEPQVELLTLAESEVYNLLEAINSLDQQRKALRSGLDTAVANAQGTLRNVAIYCEKENRTEEALLSAGWNVRRARSASQPVTTPTRFTAEPSAFAGQVNIRWKSVTNARFYEVQYMPLEDFINDEVWGAVPIQSWPRVNYSITGHASGRLLAVRVRAFGAKGPGPWAEPITARVSCHLHAPRPRSSGQLHPHRFLNNFFGCGDIKDPIGRFWYFRAVGSFRSHRQSLPHRGPIAPTV